MSVYNLQHQWDDNFEDVPPADDLSEQGRWMWRPFASAAVPCPLIHRGMGEEEREGEKQSSSYQEWNQGVAQKGRRRRGADGRREGVGSHEGRPCQYSPFQITQE